MKRWKKLNGILVWTWYFCFGENGHCQTQQNESQNKSLQMNGTDLKLSLKKWNFFGIPCSFSNKWVDYDQIRTWCRLCPFWKIILPFILQHSMDSALIESKLVYIYSLVSDEIKTDCEIRKTMDSWWLDLVLSIAPLAHEVLNLVLLTDCELFPFSRLWPKFRWYKKLLKSTAISSKSGTVLDRISKS